MQSAWETLVLAVLASVATAGNWHSGTNSLCSDCHTMHNSSGGAPMRYDADPTPAPHLLRHATSISLCIYCHDGSTASSPDVIDPVSYTGDPAGGFFPSTWSTATGTAHVLGSPDALLPPGGSQAMVLTCITCHDPHGSASFRNLKPDPAGTGTASLTVTAKQRLGSDGTNADRVYTPSNIIDKSGMSAWCGACHGNFHGRSADAEGTASPWLRHPQDQAIAASTHVDYTYWLTNIPNRVRVQTPNDDVVPSADDQVFCLSCHKAHGWANRAALVFADGVRLGSTCQQCHNK